jgi:hypothetical protein
VSIVHRRPGHEEMKAHPLRATASKHNMNGGGPSVQCNNRGPVTQEAANPEGIVSPSLSHKRCTCIHRIYVSRISRYEMVPTGTHCGSLDVVERHEDPTKDFASFL